MVLHLIEANLPPKIWKCFVDAKIYPYTITRGHLNNFYTKDRQRQLFGWKHTAERSNAYLCIIVLGVLQQSDIVWARMGVNIQNKNEETRRFENAELICDIQVSGGSYARLGKQNLEWDHEIQCWILPTITRKAPLCDPTFMGKYPILETDGRYLSYGIGFFSSNLRRTIGSCLTT